MLESYESQKKEAMEWVEILRMLSEEDRHDIAKYLRGAALLTALQREREREKKTLA